MQTFLPLPSFWYSLHVLDNKRLGKQRVEAKTLIHILEGLEETSTGLPSKGWVNHPATKMWEGYLPALKHYYNTSLDVWQSRRMNNTMARCESIGPVVMPPWFGNEQFHSSHRSNLLRKDAEWYGQFGWNDDPEAPYIWPSQQTLVSA